MNTHCLVALPRDLERLVRDALAAPGRLPPQVEIARAARAFELTSGRVAPCAGLLSAAESELARLHRVELAFHLREAARARLAGDVAPSAGAERRARLREALACAANDGMRASPALFALLGRCVRPVGEVAPCARELTRAALDLHDVEAGRVLHAEALLAAGEIGGAERAFALALARRPSARAFDRLLAGWIAAARRGGELARARELERAASAAEVAA